MMNIKTLRNIIAGEDDNMKVFKSRSDGVLQVGKTFSGFRKYNEETQITYLSGVSREAFEGACNTITFEEYEALPEILVLV